MRAARTVVDVVANPSELSDAPAEPFRPSSLMVIPIAPEAVPLCPSYLLGASVGHPVLRGLLALVAFVMPCQAGLDLIEARIRPGHR